MFAEWKELVGKVAKFVTSAGNRPASVPETFISRSDSLAVHTDVSLKKSTKYKSDGQ